MSFEGAKLRPHLPWVMEGFSPEQSVAFLLAELNAAKELLEREQAARLQLASENRDLHEKVYKDPLTGCFNRRFLQEQGPVILDNASNNLRSPNSRLIVVRFDVNDMKGVNDQLGHDAGDELLRTVTTSVQKALKQHFKRDDDKFLIRDGGDEFVLLLQNSTPDYVDESFRRINESTSFTLNGSNIDVKCAYGYAVYEGQGMDAAMKQADLALYDNKQLKADGLRTTITPTANNKGPEPTPA